MRVSPSRLTLTRPQLVGKYSSWITSSFSSSSRARFRLLIFAAVFFATHAGSALPTDERL